MELLGPLPVQKKKCVMSLFAKVEEHHIEKEDTCATLNPRTKTIDAPRV
jgi:hypothetical protein